jgi:hypothetical protein
LRLGILSGYDISFRFIGLLQLKKAHIAARLFDLPLKVALISL